MKTFVIKLSFFLSVLLIMGIKSSAQTLLKCGNDQIDQKLIQARPEILLKMDSLETFTKNYIAHMRATGTGERSADTTTEYIIPVVFHVIHNYGSEDISDAQIIDEMRILNEDYNKLNPDTSVIIPQFKSIAANCHMTFKLAQIDPNGDCTTGIEHIKDLLTYDGNDDVKFLYDWPRDKYLNIWVVDEIKISFTEAAGYAYFPSEVDGDLYAPLDGVIILSSYVGSIGTGSAFTSRAVTHEIGHTMNLQHPWGLGPISTACGDDNVYDTPMTEGWDLVCDLSGSICNPPVIENVQNYMEYSYCSKMFTNGQKDRIYAALNSSQADRTNLWSAANLAATGVDGNVTGGCAPKADFKANEYFACEGNSIIFSDLSWKGAETNRTWLFTNGTPATSTSANPSVSFSDTGWQTVTLIASNAYGADTAVQQKYIYVSPSQADFTPPFIETFNDAAEFNNKWFVVNPEGNQYTWSLATNAGYDGNTSARLYNYGDFENDYKYLISPSFNLSVGGSYQLTFNYTAATQTSDINLIDDSLKIYISTNCGSSWYPLTTISGLQLANAGQWTNNYVPKPSGATWTFVAKSIPSYDDKSNVRFKFDLVSGGSGNNLYLDDITVGLATGISQVNAENSSLNVFPDPASESATVSYHLTESDNVRLDLMDISGRLIAEPVNFKQQAGDYSISLNNSTVGNLANGIYLVQLWLDGTVSTKKLVIAKN